VVIEPLRVFEKFRKRSEKAMEKKYRNELKYVCTEAQLRMIEQRIRPFCQKDPHAGPEGIYHIRSVYFDDIDNRCFYENEDGVNAREKFRIRIYNADAEYITLECKQKRNGKNHKDSCSLTRELCEAVLNGSITWNMVKNYTPDRGQKELLHKFFVQYCNRHMRGKVIVSYERTPYIYDVGNVRITLDRHIAGASDISEFLEPTVNGRPVMPTGYHVLEVKYDEFLPDFLKNAMQIGTLRRTTYSKYYICRKFCG